jgi:type II secretory pathway component PulF
MSWRWRWALSSPRLRAALRSELLAELARPADLGEPWPEAIAAAATEHSSGAVRSALGEIAPRLADGDSLSESLRGLEEFVGAETRVVLRNAERAGNVESALAELESATLREEDAGARLRQTWVGPVITMLVALLVYGILASSTIPALATMLGETKPWVMRVLPGWGMSVTTWAWIWAVIAIGVLLSPRLIGRLPGGERLIDALPYWGSLRRSARGVHAARSLSRLLGAGVSLDESLEATAGVLRAGDARQEMRGAAFLLRDGASAREVFDAPGSSMPPILRAVLAAADGDDGLADGLERLARFEDVELDRQVGRVEVASSLAALAVAAVIAGLVVIAGWSAYFDSLNAAPF